VGKLTPLVLRRPKTSALSADLVPVRLADKWTGLRARNRAEWQHAPEEAVDRIAEKVQQANTVCSLELMRSLLAMPRVCKSWRKALLESSIAIVEFDRTVQKKIVNLGGGICALVLSFPRPHQMIQSNFSAHKASALCNVDQSSQEARANKIVAEEEKQRKEESKGIYDNIPEETRDRIKRTIHTHLSSATDCNSSRGVLMKHILASAYTGNRALLLQDWGYVSHQISRHIRKLVGSGPAAAMLTQRTCGGLPVLAAGRLPHIQALRDVTLFRYQSFHTASCSLASGAPLARRLAMMTVWKFGVDVFWGETGQKNLFQGRRYSHAGSTTVDVLELSARLLQGNGAVV